MTALGRSECVAQRMNPSEFAISSLPSSACTLDTEGSFGPDRITRTTYDDAGQVTQVQTGYGVTGGAGRRGGDGLYRATAGSARHRRAKATGPPTNMTATTGWSKTSFPLADHGRRELDHRL